MHPAFSVIFFTVVSGCGYGLLFLLGLGLTIAPQAFARDEVILGAAIGAALAAAGLVSSLLHLGQPQRAWRAFSQWRSSWLSREGIAALASFAPVLALLGAEWNHAESGVLRACGLLLAAAAVCTVVCTAKIYTTLKTIPAWHNALVLPGYLLLGSLGGAAWSWLLVSSAGARALPLLISVLAAASYALKLRYWRSIDAPAPDPTPESATGLGRFGAVRSAETPHTEENYLTREMGFALARKHAARLRRIALMLLGPLPIALALLALVANSALATPCAIATLLVIGIGTFVERWLFFAEARHVVMLYYAARRA